MSTLDIVAEVLREVAPRALKAREIAARAGARLPTASRTPETVVSRDLALDVKYNGASSRFLRAAPGEFMLKEALPTVFYNDNDKYAVSWTKNLISAGEIAAGVVDDRSIRDLKPADVASYRQCHFFSGIGVWSRALRDAGFPDDANVWSGSCPCTPFSSAGQKKGFDDDRHLWPDWFRLIRACRPTLLFGVQVSSKDGLAWVDLVRTNLEDQNYAFRVLDIPAACVGAPHKRQRLYFVAYARQRGREILSAPWLHDRGQRGHDTSGRGQAHDPSAVSDATSARPQGAQDARADRTDAVAGAEASQWRSTWDLEPQRDGDADGAGAVSDAERVVRHAGRTYRAYGWAPIEPDGHGEVDGAWRDGGGSGELGDAGLDGAGQHRGELPGDEGQHEERSAQGDHASVASGPAYSPGDRVRIVGDPGWGGAVRGFWAEEVEWIYCRPTPGYEDGCFRPARAGIKPLAFGFAPELGRTRSKRLMGYGNGIVRPQAVEFIGAVLDSFVDAAQASAAAVSEEDAA